MDIYKNFAKQADDNLEAFLLDASAQLEEKMREKKGLEWITACPKSPYIQIASEISGKPTQEIFTDFYNRLGRDFIARPMNNGTSKISLMSSDVMAYNHNGRRFTHNKKTNVLESIGSSIKIPGIHRDEVETAFKYLDLLSAETLGCSYSELKDRVIMHLMENPITQQPAAMLHEINERTSEDVNQEETPVVEDEVKQNVQTTDDRDFIAKAVELIIEGHKRAAMTPDKKNRIKRISDEYAARVAEVSDGRIIMEYRSQVVSRSKKQVVKTFMKNTKELAAIMPDNWCGMMSDDKLEEKLREAFGRPLDNNEKKVTTDTSDTIFDFNRFKDVYEKYSQMFSSNFTAELAQQASKEIYDATNGNVDVRIICMNQRTGAIVAYAGKSPKLKSYANSIGVRNSVLSFKKFSEHVRNAFSAELENKSIKDVSKKVYNMRKKHIGREAKEFDIQVSAENPVKAMMPSQFERRVFKKNFRLLELTVKDSKLTIVQTRKPESKVKTDSTHCVLTTNGHNRAVFSKTSRKLNASENILFHIVKRFCGWKDNESAVITLQMVSDDDNATVYKVKNVKPQGYSDMNKIAAAK